MDAWTPSWMAHLRSADRQPVRSHVVSAPSGDIELRFTLQERKLCSRELWGVTEALGVLPFPSARTGANLTNHGMDVESAWRAAGYRAPAGRAGNPRRQDRTVAGSVKPKQTVRGKMSPAVTSTRPAKQHLSWGGQGDCAPLNVKGRRTFVHGGESTREAGAIPSASPQSCR